MTSFSSVGYGDVTGDTDYEYIYQCFIEMIGIGIFGYMTGLLQSLIVGLKNRDMTEENKEYVNFWLIQLDQAKPQKLLSKMVFYDVRMFYEKQFGLDPTDVIDNEYFDKLKPRLKKVILDIIFERKYQLFEHVLEGCSDDFKRDLVLRFKFRFHNEIHKDQRRPNIFNQYELEMPMIQTAYEKFKHIYFIVSGEVHIMDR